MPASRPGISGAIHRRSEGWNFANGEKHIYFLKIPLVGISFILTNLFIWMFLKIGCFSRKMDGENKGKSYKDGYQVVLISIRHSLVK